MFERPQGGDRALLVALDLGAGDPHERLAELTALAVSAGADRRGRGHGRRKRPDAALFAGKGKVDEIAARRTERGADLVIFDHALSRRAAAQPREGARVPRGRPHRADPRHLRAARAQRRRQAASRAGAGQHQLTRLVGGWTHLERQKGGIGLRGPGETQLETDRRLLGDARQGAERAPRARRAAARDAKPHAAPRRGAHRRARRLHQRRQVDAVQSPHRRRRSCRRPAVRDARHDAARVS